MSQRMKVWCVSPKGSHTFISLPQGIATTCRVADTSMPAASGFTTGSTMEEAELPLFFVSLLISQNFEKASCLIAYCDLLYYTGSV